MCGVNRAGIYLCEEGTHLRTAVGPSSLNAPIFPLRGPRGVLPAPRGPLRAGGATCGARYARGRATHSKIPMPVVGSHL